MSDVAPTVDLAPDALIQRPATSNAGARPYAPSWVNRLTWRIDALHAPSVVFYLVFGAAAVVMSNAQDWIAGRGPFPNLTLQQSYWGALAASLLA